MVLGIISAMEEELEPILQEMDIETRDERSSMTFYKGTFKGKQLVAVVSGIGKVNAAVCSQILISDYCVSKIINVGIAGGIGLDIYPGDIVIATDLVQHDVDATAFSFKYGQVPRLDTFEFKCDLDLVESAKEASKKLSDLKTFYGRIASGDQFIADVEKIKWLDKEFKALACEMEGASIAHVCYLSNIPFVVIRSISDNANNGASMDYENFKDIAVKNSTIILKEMLINL